MSFIIVHANVQDDEPTITHGDCGRNKPRLWFLYLALEVIIPECSSVTAYVLAWVVLCCKRYGQGMFVSLRKDPTMQMSYST